MPPKIALFANDGSSQVAEIADAVREAGATPIVCDVQVGGGARAACAFDGTRFRWGEHDFADIRAIHVRCLAPRTLPALPPVMNAASFAEYRASFLREQECQATLHAFFDALAASGRLVANRITGAYVDHDTKPQLYEKLRAWGFRAPRTLTTSDPAAAAAFVDEVGEAVVKPGIGIGSTRLVTAADGDRLRLLRFAPALFQERSPGRVLRVHVVGGHMPLALHVATDTIDSRTAPRGFDPVTLPEREYRQIVRATQALGLHYAGWDAIQGDDGALTYLDCNPGPNLMWLPPGHRRFVFRQLAAYLITFAAGGSLSEASDRVVDWTHSDDEERHA